MQKKKIITLILVCIMILGINDYSVSAEEGLLRYKNVTTNFIINDILAKENYINTFDPNLAVDYRAGLNATYLQTWFPGRGYFQFEYEKPVKVTKLHMVCVTYNGTEQVDKFSVYGSNTGTFEDEQLIYKGNYINGIFDYSMPESNAKYKYIRFYADTWTPGNGGDGQAIAHFLLYGEEAAIVDNSSKLSITADKEKIKVGEEFKVDIALENVSNIYAQDFTVNYDNKLFEYVGIQEVEGYKLYNTPNDNNGTLRFIIASQGKINGINGNKIILKLKFKAKMPGIGKVDALRARIADTEKEYDIKDDNCLEDTIIVEEGKDVNRTGEYTLLDLSIDGYYHGMNVAETDTNKYDADQDLNGKINDADLTLIVEQILKNTNYAPNN